MPISFLFDSSSILIAVREFREKAIDIMSGNFTTSLALYEVGNVIWKESSLLRRVKQKQAIELLRAIFLIIKRMNIINLSEKTKRQA
jgi:predicted nucleic acid-binding protein